MPLAWVPWKDRLLPTDLSVTDSTGTEPTIPGSRRFPLHGAVLFPLTPTADGHRPRSR